MTSAVGWRKCVCVVNKTVHALVSSVEQDFSVKARGGHPPPPSPPVNIFQILSPCSSSSCVHFSEDLPLLDLTSSSLFAFLRRRVRASPLVKPSCSLQVYLTDGCDNNCGFARYDLPPPHRCCSFIHFSFFFFSVD